MTKLDYEPRQDGDGFSRLRFAVKIAVLSLLALAALLALWWLVAAFTYFVLEP